jgi:hypothetical protein
MLFVSGFQHVTMPLQIGVSKTLKTSSRLVLAATLVSSTVMSCKAAPQQSCPPTQRLGDLAAAAGERTDKGSTGNNYVEI